MQVKVVASHAMTFPLICATCMAVAALLAVVFLDMGVRTHGMLRSRNLGAEYPDTSERVKWIPKSDDTGVGKDELEIFKVTDPHHIPFDLGQPGKWHSQVGQDWLVATLLGCKRNGYFLDLAANSARILSNTLTLERDFGWQGICIEPNPEYENGLLDRGCHFVQAVIGSPGGMKVTFAKRSERGGIVRADMDNKKPGQSSFTAYTISLLEVLQKIGAPDTIDYFSLDVEGAESMVMLDFPWERYRFNVLTVERPKKDLYHLLMTHGYHLLRSNSRFRDETWVHEGVLSKDDLLKWQNQGTALHNPSCTHMAWPKGLSP